MWSVESVDGEGGSLIRISKEIPSMVIEIVWLRHGNAFLAR